MKVKVHWCSLVSFCLSLTVLQARSATVSVDISNFTFVPTPQTINTGDSVMWMNSDGVPHTATSTAPSTEFDSGLLSQGQTYTHTFPSAGTYDYFCGVHPGMVGQIVVQGAQPQPPTVSISNPANNSTMAGPGNVSIEATATASAGRTISNVEFFDNNVSVGSDNTNPYSVTVNLAAGSHALTAKATDNTGASTTSTAVNVTVGGGGTPIANPIPAKIQKGNITIELQTVATGLISPLGLAAPDDGSKRLFVFDQVGLIYVLSNGVKLATPLLDVKNRVIPLSPDYDERGLLGIATHPNFAQNPLIYTYTSEPNGTTADFRITGIANDHQSVIAEWRLDAANTNRVDPASRREILRLDKPQGNHNGGAMHFGPDGFLYIAIGDGGAGDDAGPGHSPEGNGQDRSKILGKMVRIDVNGRTSANGKYGVPGDNPFLGQAGVLPEIWAWGLRNPYSFSFDKQNGDLLVGDVGQNSLEEIDLVTKGANLGWPVKEGSFFFNGNGAAGGFVMSGPIGPVPPDLVDPIAQYDHDEGVAVIGGYRYRGRGVPALGGKYVMGDLGMDPKGRLFYLDGSEVKELRIGATDRAFGLWLKGFGEDQDGELYVFASTIMGPSGTGGQVLKIVKPDRIPEKITKGNITIELQMVLDGLISPLGIAAPDDGSKRLFVYDQAGLIYVVTNGVKLADPLLDVRGRLVSLSPNYDERGLIGAVTHPNFAQNPLIYTYTSEPNGAAADFPITYTDGKTNNHQSVIAEWRIDPGNTNRVDPASRREILRIDKPQSNHNGGAMRFGPEGFLYFTIGDGGAADDQGQGHSEGGNAQDKTKILGKVVRINVDVRTSPNGKYGIPTDNPFAGQAGMVGEIFAHGLRNPYSFSFDRNTWDLWLGDVGQNDIEEIDKVTKGLNLGWPIKEGTFFFNNNGTNDGFATTIPPSPLPTGLTDPVSQYDHDEGFAVIGGYVYGGTMVPALSGKYVTGDWGKFSAAEGRLFYLDGGVVKELRIGANDRTLGLWLKGFGEDQDGELYVFGSTDLGPTGVSGKMLKITTQTAPRFEIVSASREGNNLVMRWSGGAPPYHLWRRTDLDAGQWIDFQTTSETNATVTIENGNAFFKVSSP